MIKKENLILVHSFPTNSVLLSGLIEYLNDYFNVYFIDLPGFHKDVPRITNISLDNFANYVDTKIEQWNLDSYLIGGISFGFVVINRANLTKACKGILAIEPYADWSSLRSGFFKRLRILLLLNLTSIFRLYKLMWNVKRIRSYYWKITKIPLIRLKVILEHIEPVTMIETARAILTNTRKCVLKELPYVLIVNPEDTSINYEHLNVMFRKNARHLMIIKTDIGHYPKRVTKDYFKDKLKEENFAEMATFIENANRLINTSILQK